MPMTDLRDRFPEMGSWSFDTLVANRHRLWGQLLRREQQEYHDLAVQRGDGRPAFELFCLYLLGLWIDATADQQMLNEIESEIPF